MTFQMSLKHITKQTAAAVCKWERYCSLVVVLQAVQKSGP